MSDHQPTGAGPDEPTRPGPPAPPPYTPPAAAPPPPPPPPPPFPTPAPTPPTAPPTAPPAPPAWPTPDGPPTAAQPPVGYAPPAAGATWGSAPPGYGPPAPPVTPAPAKRSRAGLVVGLLVVALLIVGGIVGVVLATSGGTDLTLDVESCVIAADGTLSATGTVRGSGDATDVDVTVDFVDTATGDTISTDEVALAVPAEAAARFSAGGTAGDDVQVVRCDVTAG